MKTTTQFLQKFILIYLILYIVPYGFEYIAELDLNPSSPSFWTSITTWFGETFLGWEFNPKRLMKGFDSKYDYSRFLLIASLSFILSLIWQALGKKVKQIDVKTWIITIIRYHVGLTLILYGLAKVLVLQFGQIDLLTLEGKIGSLTGMQFLWKFMSYSEFYTQVTGYIEVIGGLLLLFRRTTFLGATISFVAMANVVIIDIGYDVSVKMFAIHLLLMIIVLLAYNAKRVVQFFQQDKSNDIQPVVYNSLFPKKYKKVQYFLKAGIILYFSISQFYFQGKRLDRRKTTSEAPSLTSVYLVKKQTINGKDASNFPDNLQWKTIFLNGSSYLKNSMVVKNINGRSSYFTTKTDTVNQTITFFPFRGKKEDSHVFNYKNLENNLFLFEGIYKGDTISITSKPKAKEDYRLVKSKIKWIRDLN